jgi:hypothetical protein
MVLYPGSVQLVLFPTAAVFDTHSVVPMAALGAAPVRCATCRMDRVTPLPKGDTCRACACGLAWLWAATLADAPALNADTSTVAAMVATPSEPASQPFGCGWTLVILHSSFVL